MPPIKTKIQIIRSSKGLSSFGFVFIIVGALALFEQDVEVKLLSADGATMMHFDDKPNTEWQNESSFELSQPRLEHREHASQDPQLLSPGQNCACVLKFLESLSINEPVRRKEEDRHLMAAGSSVASRPLV